MINRKYILVSIMVFALATTVEMDFNASDADNSEIKSEESSNVIYAPVHPTNEQVEAAAATDLVTFNDSNLEQVVSDKLSVPSGEITVGDMEGLTDLYADNKNITDLTGLEYATNLSDLHLNENQISDISPISGLTNLEYLAFSFNQISDISSLSGLTNLEYLAFSFNQISDISSLSSLTNLKLLYFDFNQVSDISSLSGLTNLQYLSFMGNQISDISALSSLTNVSELYLLDNQISDVSPLSSLTNLRILVLIDNQVSDISPLSNLTNLIELYLDGNQISDISSLASLNNLVYVSVSDQHIYLDDITVYTDNELFYTVTDIDGIEHSISLGIPVEGTFNMNGIWNIPTSIGLMSDAQFSGTIKQTVNYNNSKRLTGDTTASTNEETALSDEELMSLFNIVSIENLAITVEQSTVDYSKPGEYPITFTDTDGNTFVSTLTVVDVIPTLSIDNDDVIISIGSSLTDILAEIRYFAKEISDGDLTGYIDIDDSTVDYSTPGDYYIIFTVTDEEGNIISKSVTVTIEDTNTSMSLTTTGNKSIAYIVAILIVLTALLVLKKSNKLN